MPLFDDYLATLRNPGDTEPPPSILDDLETAHKLAVSDATAAVQQRDRLLQAEQDKAAKLQRELDAAKARNFDALMGTPAGDGGNPAADFSVQRQKKTRSFDDLFKKKVTPQNGA